MKPEPQLFKPTYTGRDGKRCESETFYVRFKFNGTWTRLPAFRDVKRSRELASLIADLADCRTFGERPDGALLKSLEAHESQDDGLRRRLIDAGILDIDSLVQAEPLAVLLDGKRDDKGDILCDGKGNPVQPGYRQRLELKGDTSDHVDKTIMRVRRVLNGCSFKFWSDLRRPGAVSRIETFLAGLRRTKERKGISGRTVNYHVEALHGFVRWFAKSIDQTPPLESLHGVKDADADKRESRELDVEEMRYVIKHAEQDKHRYSLDGMDRAMLYRFSYETGLRPNTVRQLTVAAFSIDGENPAVVCPAGSIKRRKVHVQAIRVATAAALRDLFAAKTPDAKAFRLPCQTNMARMFRADLESARAAWIAEAKGDVEALKRQRSDFLSSVDHRGRKAVFYSIRHTHGTALGNAGIHQKDIAASLHHTRTSTTDRYVHADFAAKARAVAALPDVASEPQPAVLSATGTDDETPRLSCACHTGWTQADSGGQDTTPNASENEVLIRSGGIRTPNQGIMSPLRKRYGEAEKSENAPRLSPACQGRYYHWRGRVVMRRPRLARYAGLEEATRLRLALSR